MRARAHGDVGVGGDQLLFPIPRYPDGATAAVRVDPRRPAGLLRVFSVPRSTSIDFRRFADQHGQRIHSLSKIAAPTAVSLHPAARRRFPAERRPVPLRRRPSARVASPCRIFWPFARFWCATSSRSRNSSVLKIRRGDAADDGERHDLLVIMAGNRGWGARGGAQGAILAPKIQLVAGRELRSECVECRAAGNRTKMPEPDEMPDTTARCRVASALKSSDGNRAAPAMRALPRRLLLNPGDGTGPGRRCCAGACAINSSSFFRAETMPPIGNWAIPRPPARRGESRHCAGAGMSGRL